MAGLIVDQNCDNQDESNPPKRSSFQYDGVLCYDHGSGGGKNTSFSIIKEKHLFTCKLTCLNSSDIFLYVCKHVTIPFHAPTFKRSKYI